MELLGFLRFPAQNLIGCNANLRTHFQQDALPRVPRLPFTFVDINDLRMRKNLQHRGCFPLAAVGVKNLFIEYLAPHSARAIPLTPSRIVQACLYGIYKRSKFQLNRMKNRRVVKGKSFRHSLPALDCKFEPNATFTDRDETCARRKVWANDYLGPSAQNFLLPLFRVMAPES